VYAAIRQIAEVIDFAQKIGNHALEKGNQPEKGSHLKIIFNFAFFYGLKTNKVAHSSQKREKLPVLYFCQQCKIHFNAYTSTADLLSAELERN